MRWLVLFLLFVMALGFAMVAYVLNPKPPVDPKPFTDNAAAMAMEYVKPDAGNVQEATELVIEEGATGTDVAAQMARAGLIRNPELFRILLAYYEIDRDIKAGTYQIPANAELWDILQQLREGQREEVITVTVPEGWRAEQIADLLEEMGIAPREEFLTLVLGDPKGLAPEVLETSVTTLEGFLFPDTYHVPQDYGAEAFVTLMLQTFKERFLERYQAANLSDSALPEGPRVTSLDQVVIVASLVEREAQVPEERSAIAGVFLRRYALEMPLAADPTIQYALVEPGSAVPADEYWKLELELTDLKLESPFNTYRAAGLPPTPICNPGLAALDATLNPQEGRALFFVAKEDGSHAFANTFDEHLANIARYQN